MKPASYLITIIITYFSTTVNADIRISGPESVCADSETYRYVLEGSDVDLYDNRWQIAGGVLLSDVYARDIRVRWNTSGGSHYLEAELELKAPQGDLPFLPPRPRLYVEVITVGLPQVLNQTRCGPGSVTFNASGPAGTSFEWYSQDESILLTSGNTFTTSELAITTNFKVITLYGACKSSFKEITAYIHKIPQKLAVTGDSRCGHGILTLNASNEDNDFKQFLWYETAFGGSTISTGPIFNTPDINTTKSYWASQNNIYGCESQRQEVIAEIKTVVEPPVVPDEEVCSGEDTRIYVNQNPEYANINWYDSDNGGVEIASGFSVTFNRVISNNIIWASAIGHNGCESIRTEAQIIVMPLPDQPFATDGSGCEGEDITLHASGGGNNIIRYHWYQGRDDTNPLNNVLDGNLCDTYVITNSTTTLTLYVSAMNSEMCEGPRSPVIAETFPLPPADAGIDQQVCQEDNILLIPGQIHSGWELRWSGNGVSELNVFNSEGLDPGTYPVTLTVTDTETGCSNSTDKVIIVNSLPDVRAGDDFEICHNADVINLNDEYGMVYPENGTWSIPEAPSTLTGTLFDPATTSIHTYEANYTFIDEKNCTNRDTREITVNPVPDHPIITNTTRCGTGNLTLSASGGGSNVIRYKWYIDPSDEFPLQDPISNDGSGFTIIDLSGSRQIFVSAVNGNQCEGSILEVTAEALPLPEVEAGEDQSVCEGENIELIPAKPLTYLESNLWWSGEGIVGNTFNSEELQSGTYSVTVHIKDDNNCENLSVKSITINTLPEVYAGDDFEVCANSGPVDLNNYSGDVFPEGGTWSIQYLTEAISGALFDPAVADFTSYQADYSFTDINNCSNSDHRTITANKIPDPPNVANTSRCGPGDISLAALGGGNDVVKYLWYGDENKNTIYGDLEQGDGSTLVLEGLEENKNIWISTVNNWLCESNLVKIIAEVLPLPEVNAGDDAIICKGESFSLTDPDNTIYISAIWSGPGIDGAFFDSQNLDPGSYLIELIVTGENNCENRDDKIVNVIAQPNAPDIIKEPARFGEGELVFEVSHNPDLSYNWYNEDQALIIRTNNGYYSGDFGKDVNLYISSMNEFGCESPDKTIITGTIYPLPVIQANPDKYLSIGESVVLSVGDYDFYNWVLDGEVIDGVDTSSIIVNNPGSYKVLVGYYNGPEVTTEQINIQPSYFNQPVSVNYVVMNTIQAENIRNEEDIINLGINNNSQSIEYMDGLGRTAQTVLTQSTAQGNDNIFPIVYDEFGRISQEYLPFSMRTKTGTYKKNVIEKQKTFYDSDLSEFNDIAYDPEPVSQNVFEYSTLNRILEKGAPGVVWQPVPGEPESGHTIKTIIQTNGKYEVRRWEVNDTEGTPLSQNLNGMEGGCFYHPGALIVNVIINENGSVRKEYLDKQGRLILDRTEANDGNYDTYYIYDDFGLLRFVIQPKFNRILEDKYGFAKIDSISDDLLDDLTFQYEYDQRKRLVEKKIPGAGWIRMVYDPFDRLILVQDSIQRITDASGRSKWVFTKYDVWNRPVMSGIIEIKGSRTEIQDKVNSFYSQKNNPHYEVLQDNIHGYSNQTYPKSGYWSDNVLTVTYYDNYNFLGFVTWDPDSLDFSLKDTLVKQMIRYPEGTVTGQKVKVLGKSKWLNTVHYYDDRERIIQTVYSNYVGGMDRISSDFDFSGNIVSMEHLHQGIDTVRLYQYFEYDHADRLVNEWHQVNDQEMILASSLRYNELGELIGRGIHETGNKFLQSPAYRYNIRGWLTGLGGNLEDYFSMDLHFENPKATYADPEYNGNISEMEWRAFDGIEHLYSYNYDKLDRLLNVDYSDFENQSQGGTYSVEGIKYDENGNILSLQRYAQDGIVDDLVYSYQHEGAGNQLVSVEDNGNHDQGFRIKPVAYNDENHYYFDGNGNMFRDNNRGIDTIQYNHLNLSEKIIYDDENQIRYIYDALGNKLMKTVKIDNRWVSNMEIHNEGDIVYKDGRIDHIRTSVGRLVKEENDYIYEYFLKDHLGNIRVAVTSQPEKEDYVATLEPERDEEEDEIFINLKGFRKKVYPGLNHTESDSIIIKPDRAAFLDGSKRKIIGPAIILDIYPGDTVRMEVYGKYLKSGENNSLPVDGIIAALTSVFTGVNGIDVASTVSGIFESALLDIIPVGDRNDEIPGAYLNYILFDRDFNPENMGFEQIGEESGFDLNMEEEVPFHQFNLEVIAEKPGFIYVYLSNESPGSKVWFDDLSVAVSESPVYQVNDYYPFGMGIADLSWERKNRVENRYLYNGKELQTEHDLHWYDYSARMYDPAVGRWWVGDPHAENYFSWTPYNYVGNNPVLMIDPDGRDWYVTRNGDGDITSSFWREGSDEADGYENYGANFLYRQGDVTYSYNQNLLETIEEHVLNKEDWVSQILNAISCFDASSKMVNNSSSHPGLNIEGNRIGLAAEIGSIDEHSLVTNNNLSKALSYIDSRIDRNNSVLLGVDYKHGSVNSDRITDHWVALASRITQMNTGSKSYRYFDPGSKWNFKGTNPQNILELNKGFIKGNFYNRKYTVSAIRKNQ
ncbi:DUF6443 domain-containing protein [Bacteroidota bacterium]